MIDVGVWGRNPQPPEARGSGEEPPAFGDFYNFFMKITHFLGILRLKFLLKNIFLNYSIIQNG